MPGSSIVFYGKRLSSLSREDLPHLFVSTLCTDSTYSLEWQYMSSVQTEKPCLASLSV